MKNETICGKCASQMELQLVCEHCGNREAAEQPAANDCECDNTHYQNKTVCMPCWNTGIRWDTAYWPEHLKVDLTEPTTWDRPMAEHEREFNALKVEHTPTPWHIHDRIYEIADTNTYQCQPDDETIQVKTIKAGLDDIAYVPVGDEANAALIVRAVNSHEALVEALKGLFEHCAMVHKHWGEGSNAREADAAIETARKLIGYEGD